MRKVNLVIAVATYQRPESLLRLLESLKIAIERLPDTTKVSLLVVDNDPNASARQFCKDLSPLPLKYVHEPRPGISAARNAAIAEAHAPDFIIFVDDDEVVASDWLLELLLMQERTNADLVAGPVHSLLPESASNHLRRSSLFDRPERTNGSSLTEAGSGNLLCRYTVFSNRPPTEWFLESFGLTGGEDSELTRRLHREGHTIVWAEKAEAWEEVPLARANFAWLARRYRRIGAIDFRLEEERPGKSFLGIGTGLARLLSAVPWLIGSTLIHWRVCAPAFRRLFRGIGYIEAATIGPFQEYGRTQ